MEILSSSREIQKILSDLKCQGKSIGFVPTMGYLHQGHGSLMEEARKRNDILVVSIFVNPRQFGPNEDLSRYPRDFERDRTLCEKEGVDYVFCPQPEEMYPSGFETALVAPRSLSDTLCGRSRPGHFDGVVTVVAKLFNIVLPTRSYFGEKDYQQLTIIRKMVHDLNFPVEIVGNPIIREPDGLALSSRNSYLNADERIAATVLHRSLILARRRLKEGERRAGVIKEEMTGLIRREPFTRIDYIQIVDPFTLKDIAEIEGPAVIAVAVFIGKTRLIDNISIEISPEV